jgi:hypothetical protein
MRDYSPAAFARKLLGAYAAVGIVPPAGAFDAGEARDTTVVGAAERVRRGGGLPRRRRTAPPPLIFEEAKHVMRKGKGRDE